MSADSLRKAMPLRHFCQKHKLRWLDEELDILLADKLVVDVDALDSAVEADIYVLPLAFQGLHLLVAGILIPSVVVHHTAAWFGAVYQHQLFQFIVRRGEIGYAFILAISGFRIHASMVYGALSRIVAGSMKLLL